MTRDTQILYERLLTDSIPVPSRSVLYSLEPLAIRTPYTEGLTGYISRLAEAHTVSPKLLIMKEVLPYFNRSFNLYGEYYYLNKFWRENASLVNSVGLMASQWIEVLSLLTKRQDLLFLTMQPWRHIFSPFSCAMIRKQRYWCPLCYEQWREFGNIIYDPLIWSITEVEICSVHNMNLHSVCPHCHKTMAVLTQQIRPGYCSHCAGWLGLDNNSVPLSNSAYELDFKQRMWKAHVMGELIAAAPSLPKKLNNEILVNNLKSLIESYNCNMSEFAREIKMTVHFVWEVCQGQSRISIGSLLKMCYSLDITPLQIITEVIEIHRVTQNIKIDVQQRVNKPPVKVNVDQVQRFLNIEIEKDMPLSVEEISNYFDISPITLRVRFPDYCRIICKRRRDYQFQRVRSTLEKIVMTNEYPAPTLEEVSKRLGHSPGYLRKHFKELCETIVHRVIKRVDREQLEQYLKAVLEDSRVPPPSMKEVEIQMQNELGYDRSQARKYFPNLCREIASRRTNYRRTKKEARVQALCYSIRQAVYSIHSQGEYPSIHYVERYLGKPGCVLLPEVIAAWRETMCELGLRNA